MKNELPRIYRGTVKENNNLRVAHANQEKVESPRKVINELFKENHIYRQDVEIATENDSITTKIIGRTQDHIITINNSVIKIDDIKSLKIIK